MSAYPLLLVLYLSFSFFCLAFSLFFFVCWAARTKMLLRSEPCGKSETSQPSSTAGFALPSVHSVLCDRVHGRSPYNRFLPFTIPLLVCVPSFVSQVQKNKEKEQLEIMKRRAKEIALTKRITGSAGGGMGSGSGGGGMGGGGMGGGGMGMGGESAPRSSSSSNYTKPAASMPTAIPSKKKGGGMKLGKKGK
jgi:uncharacterized membrane protein YgcG